MRSGENAATTTRQNESDPRKVSTSTMMIEMIATAADPAAAATDADVDCFVATPSVIFPPVAAAAAIESVLIASSFAILFFADDAIFLSVSPAV